jgi:Phosphate transport regulator (distant homolog of PhoU)
MKLDKILQIFVVKEKKFFPLYIQSAENIVKAASLLIDLTKQDDPDERRIYSRRIKECETAGDNITDTIIDELMNAFVTPFDRDDIHQLAEDMDTFLDCIRDSSKKFAIYQPKGTDKKLTEIAEYLYKDAELFLQMTQKFATMRDDVQALDQLCDQVKENEHIVDDIYESYMSSIFVNEKDYIELVKKKNIVQALEDTSDVAKRLSDTIRSIVVKMG